MAKKSTDLTPSYCELQQQLDALLAQLEDPEIDVDEATKLYKQAHELISRLETHLNQAEISIQKVRADFTAERPEQS